MHPRYLVMSRRQSFSALGATSLEHEASVLARHASAEAVRLCASSVVRLKSALGHRNEFSLKTKMVRLAAGCVYVKERATESGLKHALNEAINGCCFIQVLCLINPKLLC